MTKIRRVDFYFDDWIGGNVPLTLAERGLFWTACAMIYSHGGLIELADLRRLCPGRGRAFKTALDRLLALGKLYQLGDKIGSIRAELELKRSTIRVELAHNNGAI